MIEPVLLFSLGFLTSALLAMMMAPAIWRRAVRLTRKRIEATVPLSLNEIQAERDKVRAESALAIRRMEIKAKAVSEKAATQLIELDRLREEIKSLVAAREARDATIRSLETKAAERDAELAAREERLATIGGELAAARQMVHERGGEIERLGRMYDDSSFAASSRQIELVARDAEIEKQASQIAELKALRKDAERRVQEANSALKVERETAKSEKRRAAELDRKYERMVGTISEHEEKITRREKELARLREKLSEKSNGEARLGAEIAELRAERSRLRTDLAERSRQLAAAADGDARLAIARLASERDRLEQRLATLARENRRLKGDSGVESDGASQLRERMQALAAEVVALTARLDGPDSPILRALKGADGSAGGELPISLAERIRTLLRARAEAAEAPGDAAAARLGGLPHRGDAQPAHEETVAAQ